MTDELIDILHDDLSYQKTALKSEAHKYGWLHASVHIWFYTENNELLFQKRSPTKIAFPNKWDVSVAGHIPTGETPMPGALREIEEEIGLIVTENELIPIGTFQEKNRHKVDFVDNEIYYLFLVKLKKNIDQLKIQQEELTALKLIPLEDCERYLKSTIGDPNFASHSSDYYQFVFNHIKIHASL